VYVYESQLVQGKSREHLGRDEPYLAEHVPSVPPALLVAAAMRSYLSPPLPGMYGFDGSFDVDLRGLYSEPQARLVDLLHVNEGTPIHRRLLQMGSVSHVVALHAATFRDLERLAVLPSSFPEPIHVFRVPATLPRAFAVGGARVAQGPDALRTLIDPAFDPAREVLLDEGAPRDPPRGFGARVRIVSARADRALLEAEMEHPGFVVLTEGYDPGWRARIDGRPAPVLRANLGFRAVAVGPGRHAIEYVYRPASVRLGAGLFALGLLGFAAAALGRARRPPPPA
jgi:hypothetical protein